MFAFALIPHGHGKSKTDVVSSMSVRHHNAALIAWIVRLCLLRVTTLFYKPNVKCND